MLKALDAAINACCASSSICSTEPAAPCVLVRSSNARVRSNVGCSRRFCWSSVHAISIGYFALPNGWSENEETIGAVEANLSFYYEEKQVKLYYQSARSSAQDVLSKYEGKNNVAS